VASTPNPEPRTPNLSAPLATRRSRREQSLHREQPGHQRERVLPEMLSIFLLPRLDPRFDAAFALQPRHRRLKILDRDPRRIRFARIDVDRDPPLHAGGVDRRQARRPRHAGRRGADEVFRRVGARAREVAHHLV